MIGSFKISQLVAAICVVGGALAIVILRSRVKNSGAGISKDESAAADITGAGEAVISASPTDCTADADAQVSKAFADSADSAENAQAGQTEQSFRAEQADRTGQTDSSDEDFKASEEKK